MIDSGNAVDVGVNPFGTALFSEASFGAIASRDWSSAAGSSFDSFGSSWD